MSLHHIAKHLKDQGRGPDDMLVHMSSKEVAAMQQLAKAHGGSLTINPQTGLPEAGFLSSVLPMALGAAAVATGQVEFLPYIAAGVGVADYAMTGSLTQGLMAGLGTWSGGSLAGGLAAAGATGIAQEGGNLAAEEFAKQQAQALAAAGGDEINQTAAREIAKSQVGNMANLTTDQVANMTGQGLTNANAAEVVKAAGAANAAMGSSAGANLAAGAGNLSNYGSVIAANPYAAAGIAAPLLMNSNLLGTKKGPIPGINQSNSNPFGLKNIPKDENGNPIFNASQPVPVSNPIKPTYPNYVANPYNAYGAASGGVMKMAEGGSAPLIGTPAQNSTMNSTMGNNATFPMSDMARSYYSTPTNLPAGINSQNNNNPATSDPGQIPGYGPRLDTNTGQMTNNFADGGLAGMPYMQQVQNQPATSNGYTPAGGGSTYGQGQFSTQTNPMPPTGLQQMNQMGMPPAQFAKGGISQYSGKYESMVSGLQDIKEGADIASRRPMMETTKGDPGIYEDESDLRGLDSYNRTLSLLKKNLTSSHVKPAKGLPKSAALGAIDLTPAVQAAAEQQAKASIAKDSNTSEAKEGGLMHYADGGSTMQSDPNTANLLKSLGVNASTGQALQGSGYNPSDLSSATGLNPSQLSQAFAKAGQASQNNPASQFNTQQATQAYSPQIIQTPMASKAPSSTGYAIDPKLMVGTPQNKVEQDRVAAERAAQDPFGIHDALNNMLMTQSGASGGLMPDALKYAMGGHLNGYAMGGNLGSYSDGGHLLKGPGDGVSDSIPATIGGKQPARLAEGEFVIPARIVSELGNGSTDAGAKRLYAMMDRIKAKRSKAKNIAADTKVYKYLPA